MKNAEKNTCPRGHAYTDDNTYVNPVGWRLCRTCRREARMRRPAAFRITGNTGVRNGDKTCCPQGHPYDGTNTYIRPGKNWRLCRECRRASAKRLRRAGAAS